MLNGRGIGAAAGAAACIALGAAALAAAAVTARGSATASHGFVAPPAAGQPPFPSCPPLGLIGLRGSGENLGASDWGHGLGPPALQVAADISKVTDLQYTYVPYPAVSVLPGWSLNPLRIGGALLNGIGAKLHTYWLGAYHASLLQGETRLRAMIIAEEGACSSTRIAIVGYSQGAQAAADVYTSLSTAHRATLTLGLFGDPRYNHNSWTVNLIPNLDNDGVLPGVRPAFPADADGKVVSVCHPRDPICQGTGQALLHGDSAHKTYNQEPDPSAVATDITPFPLPSVACANDNQPPLADITFKYRRALVLVRDRPWALSGGIAHWRYFSNSDGTVCKEVKATGAFVSSLGAHSPAGTVRLSPMVSGGFREAFVDTLTGRFVVPADHPTHGFVGTTDFNCSIAADGSSRCAGTAGSFNPDVWYFPGGANVRTGAFDTRYGSISGQRFWNTNRFSFGDIRG